jgi:hypothetical protein
MLEEHWKSMTATRRKTLKMAANLSQRQSEFTASPGQWTIGEVLDHLILADRFYCNEIAALIDLARKGESPVLTRSLNEIDVGLALAPRGLLSMLEVPLSVMNLFVPRALRSFMTRNRIFAAQNPSAATPSKARPIAMLRKELASSPDRLRKLFDSNPRLDYSRMIHRHPVMGVNDVAGLLRMAEMHERRHQQQIREVLEDPDFPVA